jgi:phage terminase large subunit-like protein
MNEDYIIANHTKKICDLINKFLRKEIRHLAISLPPRAGKSEICSYALPMYILGLDPTTQIIATTYGQDLSRMFSRRVISGMGSDRYKQLFPQTVLDNVGSSANIWYTTQGGYFKSTSRGSALTGAGANIIIADDLIKNSIEASSPTLLESMRDWFDTTLASRLLSGGQILMLQTRWVDRDLIGHVLSNDIFNEWTYLNIEALDENGRSYWEEKFSTEYLVGIKHRNPKQFACLYQGNPTAIDATDFSISDYKILNISDTDTSSTPKYYFASWDTAVKTGDSNDYTACTVWSAYSNRIVLEDYVKERVKLPELYKLIEKTHNDWGCKYTLIEDSNNGSAVLQLLNKKWYVPIPPNVSKKLLITTTTLEEHEAWLRNFSEVISQLEKYPNGTEDDCVASIVNAIWWWKCNKANQSTVHPPNTLLPRRVVRVPKLGGLLRH